MKPLPGLGGTQRLQPHSEVLGTQSLPSSASLQRSRGGLGAEQACILESPRLQWEELSGEDTSKVASVKPHMRGRSELVQMIIRRERYLGY